jgi:glutamine amidotransferase-like uncharacterized protein
MATDTRDNPNRPLALVYRGPASCCGCSEAVADVLQASNWNFDVQYVGPDEPLKLSAAALQSAALYAQPGGNGTVEEAYEVMRSHKADLQSFIWAGGRYLGFCMGGYLAGRQPGFNLFPGDTDQWICSDGASVTHPMDTVTQVQWREQTRWMYVQDPPDFVLDSGASSVSVIAQYTNGQIAALVTPYERGRVAVVGPHPEAPQSWYSEYHLKDPDGPDADLAKDLIDSVMR